MDDLQNNIEEWRVVKDYPRFEVSNQTKNNISLICTGKRRKDIAPEFTVLPKKPTPKRRAKRRFIGKVQENYTGNSNLKSA